MCRTSKYPRNETLPGTSGQRTREGGNERKDQGGETHEVYERECAYKYSLAPHRREAKRQVLVVNQKNKVDCSLRCCCLMRVSPCGCKRQVWCKINHRQKWSQILFCGHKPVGGRSMRDRNRFWSAWRARAMYTTLSNCTESVRRTIVPVCV